MATIPSIAMIPSGYKANKVYSVLPTDGSGDLDFARTSTATRVNSEGLIETVLTKVPRLDYTDGSCPSLLLEPSSTNLITQSEAFGNSYWAKSGASIEGDASTAGSELVNNSNWVVSNVTESLGVITFTDDGADSYALLENTLTVGLMYKISYTIDSYSNGALSINEIFNVPTSVGNHTIYSTATNQRVILDDIGETSLVISNVSVKEVQGFSAPSVDSPLGAFKLVESSANESHYLGRITTGLTTGGTYTTSIICKAGEINWLLYIDWSSTANSVYLDISNKAVGTKGATMGDVKFEDLADGFVRVSLTYPLDAAQSQTHNRWYLATGNGASTTYTGDGTSGVYIFGAQLEQQSYATSYIPTAGTTISRTADSASKSGISSLINSSEGVLYAESSGFTDSVARLISLSDGTNTNRMYIGYTSTLITTVVIVGGSVSYTYSFTPSSIGDVVKMAVKFKANDFSLYVNGVKKDYQLSGSIYSATTLNRLGFDSGSGASNFYGNVNDLRVFKTALTDSELQILTSL